MGERGFEEGQWYTNGPGDAVRIDRVHNGWVYFIAWKRHQEIGAPKRMPVDVFSEALDLAGMALESEGGVRRG